MTTYTISFYAKKDGVWARYSCTFGSTTRPTLEEVQQRVKEMWDRAEVTVLADLTLQLEEGKPVTVWQPPHKPKNTSAWKPRRYGA